MSDLVELINTLSVKDLSYNDKFDLLLDVGLTKEQAPCDIRHIFSPGVYTRELTMYAGTFIIGQYHKTEHLNIMLKGVILLAQEDGGYITMTAPLIYTSKPGRKMAYVIEDTVWLNVHSTNETDIDKLEEVLLDKIEPVLKRDDSQLLLAKENYYIQECRDDFIDAVSQLGLTEQQVKELSEYEEDLIPFPSGEYKVEVKASKIHGRGLFASSSIKEGEIFAPARLSGMRTPAGRYINHSILPNAIMFMEDNGDTYVKATKEIKGKLGGQLGEEVLVDYYTTFLVTREKLCQEQ